MTERPPASPPTDLPRRRVFAAAGGVGALAAVAAAVPLVRAPAAAPAPSTAAATPSADGRYQLSAHVQRYYQTTKV